MAACGCWCRRRGRRAEPLRIGSPLPRRADHQAATPPLKRIAAAGGHAQVSPSAADLIGGVAGAAVQAAVSEAAQAAQGLRRRPGQEGVFSRMFSFKGKKKAAPAQPRPTSPSPRPTRRPRPRRRRRRLQSEMEARSA